MTALCRAMAIMHIKICMPLRWLAGNTHFLGQQGYDWSARSMGKAVDALERALVEIESDGGLYLDETFLDGIFRDIYTNDDGDEVPLKPLEEYMNYALREKQTARLDGSKVLPWDQLCKELFHPTREENIETDDFVKQLAVEIAQCMLEELRDPKKATSDYLSSREGKFSWGQTSHDEHVACIGKMATNDPAESPFASLTRQLQTFGRVLGIHASAVGHARVNKDFGRDYKDDSNNGNYWKLTSNQRESLLRYALSTSPHLRKSEKTALDKQRAAKKAKNDLLIKTKMLAAQQEYVAALMYNEMYYSDACWKTKTRANAEYKQLTSRASKLRAVKEQHKIRILGFGWKDLHHPYSKNGEEYSPDILFNHLVNVIIPEQRKRPIPDEPNLELPSRKETPQLGTKTADVRALDECYEQEKNVIIEEALQMREQMEDDGVIDRFERLQPATRPDVNEDLLNKEIEILYEFTEPCGKVINQWCQGVVVAIKRNNKIHISWRESTLREGDVQITEETLMKSKWNKHVPGGWRYSIEN